MPRVLILVLFLRQLLRYVAFYTVCGNYRPAFVSTDCIKFSRLRPGSGTTVFCARWSVWCFSSPSRAAASSGSGCLVQIPAPSFFVITISASAVVPWLPLRPFAGLSSGPADCERFRDPSRTALVRIGLPTCGLLFSGPGPSQRTAALCLPGAPVLPSLLRAACRGFSSRPKLGGEE